MSAVVEEEVKAPPKFQMPKVSPGMYVLFWRDGKRMPGGYELARVIRSSVSGQSIHIEIVNGHQRDGIRHVDDPRLAANPDMRKSGAWEHTEDTLAIQALLNGNLLERVKLLEEMFESPKKK